LPAYRFVDLFRAIEFKVDSNVVVDTFDAECAETLAVLLHGETNFLVSRSIGTSSQTAWTIGDDEEEFLAQERYWIFHEDEIRNIAPTIIRLKYSEYEDLAKLEVAAPSSESAKKTVESIIAASISNSIYKNSLLSVSFESGSKDEYGDVEKPEQLRVRFNSTKPVSKEQFVVDDTVYDLLWRNVVDLHRRRDVLKKYEVPLGRGVLLYGPPGTGKTFACRYVCGELTETTRIMVAGNALNRIGQIFDLARIYHPSLVVLEDVDLVFSSRDINLYSSSLGELLDQMDGLRPNEDIGVVLTTNSIERMESAIKDRPGRISQCIYFGSPGSSLRKRFLEQYLNPYDTSDVEISELVIKSEGTTPAFIKEWVHRSVQIASERIDDDYPNLDLRTGDFIAAKEEMMQSASESSRRIIGFIGN